MRARPVFIARTIAASLALAAAGGCTVGPDFARPAPPDAARYTTTPLPETTATAPSAHGEAQRFASDADVAANWWTRFGCAELDRLVRQALATNPSLQAAQATLRVAQENVAAQRGAFWPSLTADLDASRQKTAPVLSPTLNSAVNPYSLRTAQVLVSYSLDVFGGNRRQVESLAAQAEAQRFQWQAARVTLAANVVVAVVQAAALRDQLDELGHIVELQAEQLGLMRRQLELGAIAEAAVVAQESALAQTRAQLPALEKQLAQQNDLLAALSGRLPAEQAPPTLSLASLHLPEELPLSLPSKLVEQRPDVRAAEAQLHAASAQIGVAIANRLPQITLTAAGGSTATHFADLFAAGTGFFGAATDVAQPIFQGGTLQHRQRAAQAAYAQAAAQYRSTVIAAFQNVADTLEALRYDAQTLHAAVEAERTARRSFELARRQMELGDVSALALLAAEQNYRQAVIARVQAEAARLADTVALFQALGGGWWNATEAVDARR